MAWREKQESTPTVQGREGAGHGKGAGKGQSVVRRRRGATGPCQNRGGVCEMDDSRVVDWPDDQARGVFSRVSSKFFLRCMA